MSEAVSVLSPIRQQEIKDYQPKDGEPKFREIESMHNVKPPMSNWKSEKFNKVHSEHVSK